MKFYFDELIKLTGHGIKKNSKRIFKNKKTGRHFITSSSNAAFLEKELTLELIKLKNKNNLKTITNLISVSFIFIFPASKFYTKRGIRSKNLADISNLYELPQDALQKSGIIENDSQIENHNESGRVVGCDNNYYLRIVIVNA